MSETIAPSSDPVYRLTSAHSDPIAQNSQSNTMNKAITASANPFMDPVLEQEAAGQESAFSVDSTLAVGKNASLTLATDSLIVLDEDFDDAKSSGCFGCLPSGSSNTRAIPFYNVLWAELSGGLISISYAKSTSKTVVRAETLQWPLEHESRAQLATTWIDKLLNRAYVESKQKKRALVLVNPHAGKGSAEKWYARDIEPIFKAAKIGITLRKTTYGGEAVEVCRDMDIDAYDMVVSCSGDGLPHEVFNGLGKRTDAKRALGKIAVVQMPCGSGNAMSCNLTGSASPSMAALATVKGVVAPLDLISITQGNTRTLSFLSQSVGIVAESDLATEHIRWMGQARFTYGFLIRLLRKRVYPCDLAVKVAIEGKEDIKKHWAAASTGSETKAQQESRRDIEDDVSARTGAAEDGEGLPRLRYGTVNDKLPADWETVRHDEMGNFYCGKMSYMASDANFFPAALPHDGYMDLVNIDGTIARSKAIDLMLSVEAGKFFDKPLVNYRKVLGYRITPRDQADGYISIDGERVPFEPFQAEIHRGLGTVLAKRVHRYEAAGPRGEQ